jgi:uncharacterized protein (DUF433 family)
MVLPYLHGEYVEVVSALCSILPICRMAEKERSVVVGDFNFLCHPAFSIKTGVCYNHPAMKHTPATYTDHIVLDPAILAGKPVIKGTRIPVELVLERLEEDVDTTLLFADYPQLTPADVQACLWYAKELVRGEEYSGTKSQDSFRAKIRQNSTVRETRGYPFRYTCAGV